MTEIITRPQADLLLNAVLVLGLLAGAVGAVVAAWRKQSVVWGGVVWAGPGVLAFGMWHIYNAITDRLGLDSVLNLVINALLFVFVGVVCGLLWARFAPKTAFSNDGKSEA